MATKKETAIKTAVTREKNRGKVREEKHVFWLLVAIILMLLYLLFAQHSGWWPYSRPKLGSAFYTNVNPALSTPSGTNGSAGSVGSGGGAGGGSSTTPSAAGPIADFAAGLNVGDTKTQVGGRANNLGTDCAVLASANAQNPAGKQEVCTYSQGDKIVTVTYLNDRVVSASKSGF